MADLLAESFPPRCPGDEVAIANPDAVEVDLTVEGGVRWSERPVVVLGRLTGRLLEAEVAGSVG